MGGKIMRIFTRPAMALGAVFIGLSFSVTAADAPAGELDLELLRAAFEAVDTDRDGLIGEPEFAVDSIAAFVSVDKNGDKILSSAELGAAGVDNIGKLDANKDGSVTIIEAMKIKIIEFERADGNKDGKLTLKEVTDFESRR